MPHLTPTLAARLATTALASITREYPNQIAHAMQSDADAGTPRQLHPAFYACYDWHSAVHSHWCLARLLRATSVAGASSPRAAWQTHAISTLNQHLTPDNLAAEAEYLAAPHRLAYERPYGLAWLLQLDAELLNHPAPDAPRWRAALQPLADRCADRLISWFTSLTHPVRTGVHSQSAFAMALAIDWARATDNAHAADTVAEHALRLHAHDTAWSFSFEPSGEDFLSPGLAAADLMRRILDPTDYPSWLDRALPQLRADAPTPPTLAPVQPKNTTDGRLAHLDGLSLSRAWMLEAVADALDPVRNGSAHQGSVCHDPVGHDSGSRADTPHTPQPTSPDPRATTLRALADTHLAAGLAALDSPDYNRTHWLATFAAYALTQRRPDPSTT